MPDMCDSEKGEFPLRISKVWIQTLETCPPEPIPIKIGLVSTSPDF